MGVVEELDRARAAYEKRDWAAAYGTLSTLDEADHVATPGDFERLAMSAYLTGRTNMCIQVLQRAYQRQVEDGDLRRAAHAAAGLAIVLLTHGEPAVGNGWVGRCRRVLDDVEGDTVERGYLAQLEMFQCIFGGDMDGAAAHAADVTDYGRRFHDADLLANGLNGQGRMLLYAGRVRDGLALLDEAMVAVSTGEVSAVYAGEIYCSLIEACQEVSDYGRAAEWTQALSAWVETQPDLVLFTGQCAVHRGQIMRLRGAWTSALAELEGAVARYVGAGTPDAAGLARMEAGDVHRLRGDLDAADAAYDDAIGFGCEPQPGLAQLWLARGRSSAARQAVLRLLDEPRDPVNRSRLLPGAIEVLLGSGDLAGATAAAAELTDVAASFGCPPLRAWACQWNAACLLESGEAGPAVAQVREALSLWRSLEAPYQVARCQVLLGRAFLALGDEDSAMSELTQARRTLDELGAVPDLAPVDRLLTRSRPGGLTEREVEVLRLVAAGKSNTEIAAQLVLSEKTVARHLSNIFRKLDVGSRTSAAAFAFENGLA